MARIRTIDLETNGQMRRQTVEEVDAQFVFLQNAIV